MKVEGICKRCGKEFEGWAYRNRVYCTQACYHGESLSGRLGSKTDKSDGCWEWTGHRTPFGYGLIRDGNRRSPTHRVAWELVAGPIPAGMQVLHTCDNPACVRNDDAGFYMVDGKEFPRRGHLFLGTAADNVADRQAKGRTASGETHMSRTRPERLARGERSYAHLHPETRQGERNGRAKLTADQVRTIRARRLNGETLKALASEFDVAIATVWYIAKGLHWRETC